MGYIEAYQARMKRNNDELLQLIKDVQAKDPSVEAYYHQNHTERYISSIVFFKGENINSIGFHEVPYGWSGCGYNEFGKRHSGGENVSMPFTADDVLTTLNPVTTIRQQHNTFFRDKDHYLKWCCYLKKHTNQIQ